MSSHSTLAELERAIRDDLALFSYPDRKWVKPVFDKNGERLLDVLIVGGGQSGLAAAHGLIRSGVDNVLVLDQNPAGYEGVWETFARMSELRTPKALFGIEQGLSELSLQRWYIAQHGRAAWDAVNRVPRTVWMNYLRWFREILALPVINDVSVRDVREGDGGLVVEAIQDGEARTYKARLVVMATGHDGAGNWTVPSFIRDALPASRYDHSNETIDFGKLKGKRIGILGHGASAFDVAASALEAGAMSADLCFRRKSLPVVNPHRHIETAGLLTHFYEMSDATRWAVARHFQIHDQPPADSGFFAATALPGFRMHTGSPWESVAMEGNAIRVATPRANFMFDHIIAATGYEVDLATRPELTTLAPLVALWKDRYAPPPGLEQPMLGAFPYLDSHYEFREKVAGSAPWVSRVFAFNVSAYISMCPHSTSISGHRYCLPRLIRGVTKRLALDQEAGLIADLEAYDSVDLEIPAQWRSAAAAD
jgi:cation diffusion facilitator CzcD-associated flavoprotein CzcO